MRAGVYVRISQDRTGEAAGVKRQTEDCIELAKSLGWEIHDVYQDNDTSATSGKPRKRFTELLADLEAGTIGAIIAWHPDRLYRRAVDLLPLTEICKATNAQIATVTAGDLDLSTPTGRMLAGILAQIATYEGEHKSERYKRSIMQSRRAGKFAPSGKRLFGYTNDGELIPAEAKTTRWLAKQILQGHSVTGLCAKLNARGILTTQGNEWRTTNLKTYLTNPRIAGYATIGGDIIDVDAQHKPLLKRDVWEQVVAILGRTKRVGPRPRKALLPGLIYCGLCRQPMSTGQRPPQVRTYRCEKRPGKHGCGKVSIDAQPVEEIVEAYTREKLDQPGAWELVASIQDTAGAAERAAEATALEAHLVELEASLEEAGSSVSTVLRVIERTKQRIGDLHGELAALRPLPSRPAAGKWPTDLDQRRRLVEVVVAAVHIDPRPTDAQHGVFVPERVRVDGR